MEQPNPKHIEHLNDAKNNQATSLNYYDWDQLYESTEEGFRTKLDLLEKAALAAMQKVEEEWKERAKRIFECGRNFQLTGENNFNEIMESFHTAPAEKGEEPTKDTPVVDLEPEKGEQG